MHVKGRDQHGVSASVRVKAVSSLTGARLARYHVIASRIRDFHGSSPLSRPRVCLKCHTFALTPRELA
jgi:hypothetical protein